MLLQQFKKAELEMEEKMEIDEAKGSPRRSSNIRTMSIIGAVVAVLILIALLVAVAVAHGYAQQHKNRCRRRRR